MTKPFNTLRKKMSLPARKTAAAKTKEMLNLKTAIEGDKLTQSFEP